MSAPGRSQARIPQRAARRVVSERAGPLPSANPAARSAQGSPVSALLPGTGACPAAPADRVVRPETFISTSGTAAAAMTYAAPVPLPRRLRALVLPYACVVAWAGAAGLAPPPAQAAENAPTIAACQACHGRAGLSETPGIPNLAGQQEAYLAKQLAAFRSGERRNPLMAAIAGQLDDADIAAYARYWSRAGGAASAAATSSAGMPAVAPGPAIASRMSFPSAFPSGYREYDRAIDAEHRQIALRYASANAWQALREHRALPEGATLIVETHAMRLDAQQHPLLDAQGAPQAGPVLSYSAMQIVPGRGADVPALLRNGDWDYAQFDAQRVRRDALNQAPCLACHRPIAADEHVFTMRQLRQAVAAAPVVD